MKSKAVSFLVSGMLCGALIATVVFAALKSNRADGQTQTIIKLGHGLDTNHPVHQALLDMQKELAVLSKGTVWMEIYPGGQLGSETQMIEMLQNGEVAITKISAAAMENFVPEMAVYSLPYIFRDREHYWNVLDGEVGRELLLKGENKFLRGLCYYDAGSRNFYTIDKPVLSPADLQGLKIRVMNSQTSIKMVQALGGSPTPIAWGELYSALQQGIVDGAENNPPSFYTNKHCEVCKHFTLDGHTRIPDIVIISTKIWEKLTPQQQEWIEEAARRSSLFQRNLWKEKSEEALRLSRDEENVEVYDVDVKAFAEKVQPFLAEYAGTPVGEYLKRIQETK